MCGRTACTLNPDEIRKSCRYKQGSGKDSYPKPMKDAQKYQPSYNKAPQSYSPILVNTKHLPTNDDATSHDDDVDTGDIERSLIAMRWGLIPGWFKGENIDKVNYSMNNARSDTVMEKRSYSVPLRKGQRCVVLADGFYEWNTTQEGKQPYYIYFPQPERKNDEDQETKLLTMAGIFEKTWHNDEDLYSFTIITVDASDKFAWLHHRMPAMLADDDEIRAWLDFESVPLDEALKLIKPKNCLKWHPVSTLVNNSRNHSPDCRKEVDLEELKKASAAKFASESKNMMKWLKSASTKTPEKNISSSPKSSPAKKRRSDTMMDKWVKKKAKKEGE